MGCLSIYVKCCSGCSKKHKSEKDSDSSVSSQTGDDAGTVISSRSNIEEELKGVERVRKLVLHINPALCGRLGGAKQRKVRKRKVRGSIYVVIGGTF